MQENNQKYRNIINSMITTGILTGGALFTQNAMAIGITKALESGKPVLNVRVRAEIVDQTPKDYQATALIARRRIGYMSDDYLGLKGYF